MVFTTNEAPLLADVAATYARFSKRFPGAAPLPWYQLTTKEKEAFAETYDDMCIALSIDKCEGFDGQ